MPLVRSLLGVLFILTTSQTLQSNTIYVSKNGTDFMDCGQLLNTSCGTLYFASTLLTRERNNLYVYDGQNENIIKEYFNSSADYQSYNHPCLPKQLIIFYSSNMTISFDHRFIHSLNDWFSDSCYNINDKSKWSNKYMFEMRHGGSGSTLTINNLIIDKNIMDFGVINTRFGFGPNIICNNCVFKNITKMFTPMIIQTSTFSNTMLVNNTFINVNISSVVMEIFEVKIYNSQIINATFEAFIRVHTSSSTPNVDIGNVTMYNVEFTNISTKQSLISIKVPDVTVAITDSNFRNIISGSIIVSQDAGIFYINNVFISTSQLYTDNIYGLFYFHISNKVVIENINVVYNYDFFPNCYGWPSGQIVRTDSAYCYSPVTLIANNGKSTLMNITLKINITMDQMYEYAKSVFPNCSYLNMRYDFEDDAAIIVNNNYMDVDNLYLNGISFGNYFILNVGQLSVNNLIMNESVFIEHSLHKPRILQSTYIIYQQGSIIIHNSLFIGSRLCIRAQLSDSTQIYNSVFQYHDSAIWARKTQEFIVSNCTFYRVDRYYVDSFYRSAHTLTVDDATYLDLSNNHFSGFNKYGFISTERVNVVNIVSNTFYLNQPTLYGNLSDIYLKANGLVCILDSSSSSIINNEFYANEVDASVPWIYYKDNSGINCISGNNFSNFAFVLIDTNLTSCFRPKIMMCLENEEFCQDGLYGIITADTYLMSTIKITKNVSHAFIANNNYLALDYMHILIAINNYTNQPIIIQKANILLLDSVIDNTDIWYNSDICNIVFNNRLVSAVNYISKLLIKCNQTSTSGDTMSKLQHSNQTEFVDHFSATKLYFTTVSTTYFPGSFLKFNFVITDIFNNEIDGSNISFNQSSLIINTKQSSLGLNAHFEIDKNGKCSLCENGLILYAVNLADFLDETYNIEITLDNEYLLLQNNNIPLNIVGCPVSYGAMNNYFQCHKCPLNTYNLVPNNTAQCLSCDQHSNTGVSCINGEINIKYNHWIRVDNQSLSSSICKHNYCCQNIYDCQYTNISNIESLCAFNRNYTSILCSECMNGYSSVFYSTNCQKCNEHFIYPYPAIAVILYGIFIGLYLCLSQSDIKNTDPSYMNLSLYLQPPNKCRQCTKKCLVWLKNQWLTVDKSLIMSTMKVLLFKGVLYFEQSLSQVILYSPTETSKLSWWISLFNVSILNNSAINNNPNNGYCFYNGMNEKQSILCGLIVLIVIFVWLLFWKIVFPTIQLHPWSYLLKPNYANVFLMFLLLSVGKISSVLFSMLSCKTINN
eukprot:445413_1